MKKLYLIVTLLFFLTTTIWAQNPNNHWQLGVSDVNFTNNPPSVAVLGNTNQYGKASISDDNGDLLFYTDGKTVWNKNHSVMTNGSFTNALPANNVIIMPNLSNNNQYYIFRSVQYYTTSGANSIWESYYNYSVVEFTATNPIGILKNINSNPDTFGYEDSYTTRLKNVNGTKISNLFQFGPLTVTKNSNDDAYWLIVQSTNKLLSYKIDSLGLNTIPVESTFTNTQIYDYGYIDYSGVVSGIEGANFKMSPNNSFIVGLEYSRANGVSDPDSNYLNFYNPFYKINFNSTTGIFTNYETFSGGIMVYQFEISAQSNNLFFARMKFPFGAPANITNVVDGEICIKDLTNSANPIRVLNEYTTSTPSSSFNFLQRDKYDNLLISSTFTNLNRNLFIHKVDNQDSYSNASVVVNLVSLNNNSISSLPPLIPLLTPPCPNSLVISSNIPFGTDKKQASVSIEASNSISSGAGAIYHAPTVVLKSGFIATSGSKVRIYPIGCSNTFIARRSSDVVNSELIVFEKILKVFPNPNNGIFKILVNEIKEGIITVNDIFGRTVYKLDFKNQSEFDIDLQEKSKGIYIVKVVSGDKIGIEKIIKNQ